MTILLLLSGILLPEMSLSQPIDSIQGTASIVQNNQSTGIDSEFTGYTVGYVRERTGENDFTIETLAVTIISSMKEEALQDYYATVFEYEFIDLLYSGYPLRITMRATLEAHAVPTRSIILWTLKTLAAQLMRSRYYHDMSFVTLYRRRTTYNGNLIHLSPVPSSTNHIVNNTGTLEPLAPSLSLIATPINTTSVELRSPLASQNVPDFGLTFTFLGDVLPQISIFESLMELLLVLGKVSAFAAQPTACMNDLRLDAWVFISEVSPPVVAYRLQQFHIVAILEAIARRYVLYGLYQEIRFNFRINGGLLATGCVVKGENARLWCQGLGGEGIDEF